MPAGETTETGASPGSNSTAIAWESVAAAATSESAIVVSTTSPSSPLPASAAADALASKAVALRSAAGASATAATSACSIEPRFDRQCGTVGEAARDRVGRHRRHQPRARLDRRTGEPSGDAVSVDRRRLAAIASGSTAGARTTPPESRATLAHRRARRARLRLGLGRRRRRRLGRRRLAAAAAASAAARCAAASSSVSREMSSGGAAGGGGGGDGRAPPR